MSLPRRARTPRLLFAGLIGVALLGAAQPSAFFGSGTSGTAAPARIRRLLASADTPAAPAAPDNPDAGAASAPTPAGDLAAETFPAQPGAPDTAPVPLAGASDDEGEDDGGTRIRAPYRSQWDGSTYEWGNCGVTAISMAMEYYGQYFETHAVRESINAMTGNWNTKVGVDWRYLKLALERRGFAVRGPYNARGGYQYWTLDDLLAETEQGRPVILLVHYRSLPGHEEDEWFGDHYILFLGVTRDGGVIYHDPGLPGEEGADRVIDQGTLDRDWSKTWIGQNRTAMVVVRPD